MGAGVIYSTLGGTHHTMEDIAVASAIPNMRVLAPCDPLELVEATKYCAYQKEGPVYLLAYWQSWRTELHGQSFRAVRIW